MRIINGVFIFALVFLTWSCNDEEIFGDQVNLNYWLLHENADIPIVVEGNTNSKLFQIILHGGPGSTAQEFNLFSQRFSDRLEEHHAMVYYDQRNSGMARGQWDPSKLTIDQHIEDLDKIIDFLKFEFGNDIKIFLSGHSWGGYLGAAYLLDATREAKLNAWINIDGLTHRNLVNIHNLERMDQIANLQISLNSNVNKWQTLLDDINIEIDKNIGQYDRITEDAVFDLLRRVEAQIQNDGLLQSFGGSTFDAIYKNNYDPFLALLNGRKGSLIDQMFAYDETIDNSISNITLPSLSIYGFYDVNTALQQGNYFQSSISTPTVDKKMVVLENSGHSPMQNQPEVLAQEIIDWIELYQ